MLGPMRKCNVRIVFFYVNGTKLWQVLQWDDGVKSLLTSSDVMRCNYFLDGTEKKRKLFLKFII